LGSNVEEIDHVESHLKHTFFKNFSGKLLADAFTAFNALLDEVDVAHRFVHRSFDRSDYIDAYQVAYMLWKDVHNRVEAEHRQHYRQLS
jgi:hypothetical protein